MSFLTLNILGVVIFCAINLCAFYVVAFDKKRSRQGSSVGRVSEGVFFFIATAFGAVGIYIGMIMCRHKTRKWYFVLSVPLLIIQNLITLYILMEFFAL